jgi:hypothetical protein
MKWQSQGQEIYAVSEINYLGMILLSASKWKEQKNVALLGSNRALIALHIYQRLPV